MPFCYSLFVTHLVDKEGRNDDEEEDEEEGGVEEEDEEEGYADPAMGVESYVDDDDARAYHQMEGNSEKADVSGAPYVKLHSLRTLKHLKPQTSEIRNRCSPIPSQDRDKKDVLNPNNHTRLFCYLLFASRDGDSLFSSLAHHLAITKMGSDSCFKHIIDILI